MHYESICLVVQEEKITVSAAYSTSQQISHCISWFIPSEIPSSLMNEKLFCLLLPDLDFSSPIRSCKEWWQYWVKCCTHTSFSMCWQSTNNPRSIVVVEKHFAIWTSCYQKCSIWRKFTAHCKSFHLLKRKINNSVTPDSDQGSQLWYTEEWT